MDSARTAVRSLGTLLDRRETPEVGRHARLELVFAVRRGRTVLAEAYAEPPFRVGRWFPDGDGLHMILVSSAPGVFGGDSFEQVVRVERGARVRLTSQSALQVHPGRRDSVGRDSRGVRLQPDDSELQPPHESSGVRLQPDYSVLSSTYHVAEDATLHCHWDPMIPFGGARFDQRIEVQLADTACLYWSDAFMAGREGRGERWAFASLAHELRITRGERLEYLERYRIRPEEGNVAHPWVGGGACYFGTTLVTGGETDPACAERLHAELEAIGGIRAAANALGRQSLVVRMMAGAGIPFHQARALVGRALAILPTRLRASESS